MIRSGAPEPRHNLTLRYYGNDLLYSLPFSNFYPLFQVVEKYSTYCWLSYSGFTFSGKVAIESNLLKTKDNNLRYCDIYWLFTVDNQNHFKICNEIKAINLKDY